MSDIQQTSSEPVNVFTVRISHRRLVQLIREELEAGPLEHVAVIAQYLGYAVTPVEPEANDKPYWDIMVRPVRSMHKGEDNGTPETTGE